MGSCRARNVLSRNSVASSGSTTKPHSSGGNLLRRGFFPLAFFGRKNPATCEAALRRSAGVAAVSCATANRRSVAKPAFAAIAPPLLGAGPLLASARQQRGEDGARSLVGTARACRRQSCARQSIASRPRRIRTALHPAVVVNLGGGLASAAPTPSFTAGRSALAAKPEPRGRVTHARCDHEPSRLARGRWGAGPASAAVERELFREWDVVLCPARCRLPPFCTKSAPFAWITI